MKFLLHVTCSCISYAYVLLFNIFDIFENVWDFSDCLSFSPSLLFTLVVSMAHRRKSTPAWNLLRFGASSSFNPTLARIRFRHGEALRHFRRTILDQAFIRNAKSSCQILLTPTFFLSFTIGDGSHCVTPRSPVLSCLSRSSTPTCTGLIGQYLFSSLTFGVHAFLSHRS